MSRIPSVFSFFKEYILLLRKKVIVFNVGNTVFLSIYPLFVFFSFFLRLHYWLECKRYFHVVRQNRSFVLVVNLTHTVYRLNCVQKILHSKLYQLQTVQTLKPRDELQRVWQELVYHQ